MSVARERHIQRLVRIRARSGMAGQAMVETIIVMVFLLFAFLAIFQFSDNFRVKLLCEYAAGRVARARTVGLNNFMLHKTADVSMIAASGDCLVPSGKLDALRLVGRMENYLASDYMAQARQWLDFEYWNDNRLSFSCSLYGKKLTAKVSQRRPQFFDTASYLQGEEDDENGRKDAIITGESSIEAHYPDWIR